jgi:hypothetical protein
MVNQRSSATDRETLSIPLERFKLALKTLGLRNVVCIDPRGKRRKTLLEAGIQRIR